MPSRLNGINPLTDTFMSERLKESDKIQRKKDDDKKDGNKRRYYDKLHISYIGKLLNSIHEELKEIGNKGALKGFEKIMNLIGRPPDNIIAVNFTDIVAALSEKKEDDFLRLFVLANKIDESNYELKNWINSLINFDLEQLKIHLNITEEYLQNKNQKAKKNFLDYINSINKVVMNKNINSDKKKIKVNSILNKYYLNKLK